MFPNGVKMDGGTLKNVPPNASQEVQISILNEVIDRLNGMLKTQVFSDGSSRRMIIGYQKDGWGAGKDFGMKVSIDGVDVTKATDDQLLFKMDLSTWYFYDPTTKKNSVQIGILPNGNGGVAVAKSGNNVADAF